MEKAIIPLDLSVTEMSPAHAEFQQKVFQERRSSVFQELRSFSGIPAIAQSLKPEEVYRFVFPEGEVLQKGKGGLYSGVLRKDGKISAHAKFEKVPPNLAKIATAVGTQVLLVSIAMQLSRIEGAIRGISRESHDDRKAQVLAGISLYKTAMNMENPTSRSQQIQMAIQSLTEGLESVRLELTWRINSLPEPRNSFFDNWGRKKSQVVALDFNMAEDAFKTALSGVGTLSQCYAALEEPEAGTQTVSGYLQGISQCGIDKVADKARILETQPGREAPETPWLNYKDICNERLLAQIEPNEQRGKSGSVEIEFKGNELLEVL